LRQYNLRGTFPWDWHADVGFATGYTPEEREKLVDVYMAKFVEGQIPVPIFRMLGSDPIYQYEAGLGGSSQHVVSPELLSDTYYRIAPASGAKISVDCGIR